MVEKWGCLERKGHNPDIYVLIRHHHPLCKDLSNWREGNITLRCIYRKTKGLKLSSSIPFLGSQWFHNKPRHGQDGNPAVSNTHVQDVTAQQRNHKLGDINILLACHSHVLCGLSQTRPYMAGG